MSAKDTHNVAHQLAPLNFERQFDAQIGQDVLIAKGLTRICAPNAGPYTFTGTNSFLVGQHEVFVVDPGPDDPTHLQSLLRAINGRPVKAILLTHTHKDHSALAKKLAHKIGQNHEKPPIWFGGSHRLSRARKLFEINILANSCDWNLRPDRVLRDGDILSAGGVQLRTIETPGHCANHLAFGLKNTNHVLCGDHVMGWNSTLIAVPDGSLQDYFTSLSRLIDEPFETYHPAHGGPIKNGREHARALKAHRAARNTQILDLVAKGTHKFQQIVDFIYPDVPPATRRAAAMVMHAHAEYLDEMSRVKLRVDLLGQPKSIERNKPTTPSP